MTTLNNPLDGALFMKRLGFKVFPLRFQDKRPLVSDWQNWAENKTEKDMLDIAKTNRGCNWGVHAGGSGLVVIDIDNKGDVSGSDNLQAWLDSKGAKLPDTFTVKTPSGGYHLYYYGAAKTGVNVLCKGVDIRATGGYVVAPGSVLTNGKYSISNHASFADLPAKITGLLGKPDKPDRDLSDPTYEVDQVLDMGSRNDGMTQHAGRLRGLGYSLDAMASMLKELNQRICEPPLDDEELAIIVDSIGTRPPNEARAAMDFYPAVSQEELRKCDSLPEDLEDILAGPVPPARRWLVPDWLPEGEVCSLYGAGSVGKSLVTLQLALSVSQNRPFLGQPVGDPCRTICVFCEDDKIEVRRRLFCVAKAPDYARLDLSNSKRMMHLLSRAGSTRNNLVVQDRNSLVPGPFMAELKGILEIYPKNESKLLILDNINTLYAGNENDRAQVAMFVQGYMAKLRQEYNLTILMLGHPSRAGSNIGDGLSGSTTWDAAVRMRWHMHRDKDTHETCLEVAKTNYSKSDIKLMLNWTDGYFHCVSAGELSHAEAEIKDRIGEFLAGYCQTGRTYPLSKIVAKFRTHPLQSTIGVSSNKRIQDKIINAVGTCLVFGDKMFRHDHQVNRNPAHNIVCETVNAKLLEILS